MKVFAKSLVVLYIGLLFSQNVFSQELYEDVSFDDWFYRYLAPADDFIHGYPDGTFRPNNNISVSEFIALTIRVNNIEVENTELWYQGYIEAAIENNYILLDEFDSYTRHITRGEIAKVLSRILKVYDYRNINKDKLRFLDFIPVDIIDPVSILYDYGIIRGYSDHTFRYNNNATRAEAMAMIVKTIHSSFRDINEPIPIQVYLNDANYLIVKMKLPNQKEKILEFNYGGLNSIYGLSKISNSDSQLIIGTDFIGPYIMTAQSNDSNIYKFTGGWHGSNGDGTGETTGKTNYVTIKSGETDVDRNKWITTNALVVTVSNDIKGNNSTDYILNEIVTYHITNQLVAVSVQGIAKEDLVIHRYYGLQTQNHLWNTVTYTDNSIPINQSSDSYDTNYYILKDHVGNYLKTTLEDSGLGDFIYKSSNQPKCFTRAYGKSYFNLINGEKLELLGNDSFHWKGSYFFSYTIRE